MLKAFLEQRPGDLTHLDLFGNTLFHMAAIGSNEQNISLLYSLYEHGRIARSGVNKWGKRAVDLAPTLGVRDLLLGLGFAHSQGHLFRHNNQDFRAAAKKMSLSTSSDTSMEVILYRKEVPKVSPPGEEEEEVPIGPETDKLGQRFNSAYAID